MSYPNRYWTLPRNQTDWHLTMIEYIAAGNELSRLMLKDFATSLPGIHIGEVSFHVARHQLALTDFRMLSGLYDTYALFSDILARPQNYLNGTAPVNTSGCINSCVYQLNESLTDTGNCTVVTGSAVDSYLW